MEDGRVAFLDFGLFKRIDPAVAELELQLQRLGISGDGSSSSRLCTGRLHLGPVALDPDGILAQFHDVTWWYTTDEEIQLEPEIATQVIIDMSDPRSRYFGQMRHRRCRPTTSSAAGSRCSRWPSSASCARAPTGTASRASGSSATSRSPCWPRRGGVLRSPPGRERPVALRRLGTAGRAGWRSGCPGRGPHATARPTGCATGSTAGRGGPAGVHPAVRAAYLALFPGPLLAGASGLLFGTALGTPVSIAAATLGACSRSRWRAVVARRGEEMAGERLRASGPGSTATASSRCSTRASRRPSVHGRQLRRRAEQIRLASFAAATAIGTAPRAFAYTALGGSLGNLRSPEALVAIGVLVGMALAAAALARRDLRG